MLLHTREATVAPDTPRDLREMAALFPAGVNRVLDVTSAEPGLWPLLCEKRVQEIHALSFNGSDSSLATARPETLEAVSDTGDLPPATVLLSDCALSTFRNPSPHLRAAYRMLEAGGLLILIVPNMQYYKSLMGLAQAGWRYEQDSVWDRRYLRFFTPVELKRLVAEHGFEPLRTVPLRQSSADAMRLDLQGFAQLGEMRLGPLSAAERHSFLAAEMACLAIRPAWQSQPAG